ncbi:MAG: S-layer homology domain-containing protein [Clostridia bacterium]|nr:S-layer homology domain-containing protein [Clostridia bacterium]
MATFVDAGKISDWATEYVQFNVDNSLIVGNEAKELAPNGNITRAETATVVLRLLRNAGLVDIR